MRTIDVDFIEVACPHCEEINDVWDISATFCVDGTCVSYKPSDSVQKITCPDCGEVFWIRAHLEVEVAKEYIK